MRWFTLGLFSLALMCFSLTAQANTKAKAAAPAKRAAAPVKKAPAKKAAVPAKKAAVPVKKAAAPAKRAPAKVAPVKAVPARRKAPAPRRTSAVGLLKRLFGGKKKAATEVKSAPLPVAAKPAKPVPAKAKFPVLSVGTSLKGTIRSRRDKHNYFVSIVKSGMYLIGSSTKVKRVDPYCRLYTLGKRQVLARDDDSGPGRNCLLSVYLQAGQYQLLVSPRANYNGDYQLHIKKKEHYQLTIGKKSAKHFASSSGANYYVFKVSKNGIYSITSSTFNRRTYPDCTLYRFPGTRVANDRGSGTGRNCKIRRYLSVGTYFFGVQAYWSSSQGNYQLTLQQAPFQALAQNKAATAKVDMFYKVDIKKKGRYVFETRGRGFDPNCKLYDLKGKILASNNNYGIDRNCWMNRNLNKGTYWLELSAGYRYIANSKGLVAYRHQGTLFPSTSAKKAAPKTLSLGKAVLAELKGRYDLHPYTFTLAKPLKITVSTRHPFKPTDPKCFLFDAKYQVLGINEDGGPGTNCRITRLLPAGKYFVHVGTFYKHGIYQVAVRDASKPFPLIQSTDKTTQLTLGRPATAKLSKKAPVNLFSFTLKKAGRYAIQSNKAGGTDPKCYVYTSAGKRLDYNDDGAGNRNCYIERNFKAGTYRIKVVPTFKRYGTYQFAIFKAGHPMPGTYKSLTYKILPQGKVVTGNLSAKSQFHLYDLVIPQNGYYQIATKSPYQKTKLTLYVFDKQNKLLARVSSGYGNRKSISLVRQWRAGNYKLHVTLKGNYYKGAYILALNKYPGAFPKYTLPYPVIPADKALFDIIRSKATTHTYLFKIGKAGRYIISSRTPGDKADPKSRILDQSGKRIVYDDDSGPGRNFKITYSFKPGTYALVVASASSSRVGMYQVSVRPKGTPFPTQIIPAEPPVVKKPIARKTPPPAAPQLPAPSKNPVPPGTPQPPGTTLPSGSKAPTSRPVGQKPTPAAGFDLKPNQFVAVASVSDRQVDVFTLQVKTAGYYSLETTGQLDPKCYLENKSGQIIAVNDDSGWGANCNIRKRLFPGTYTFRVLVRTIGKTSPYAVHFIEENP